MNSALRNPHSAIRNPALPLPLPPADVTLVSLDQAAACLGWHTDRATEAVESGEWPWVFDLSAGKGAVRELRVWRGCLAGIAECGVRNADLGTVIIAVIGSLMPELRGALLETRWRVSGMTLLRLHRSREIAGRVSGHTLWLNRESVVEFLKRRRVA